jgi:hypothetical protein
VNIENRDSARGFLVVQGVFQQPLFKTIASNDPIVGIPAPTV